MKNMETVKYDFRCDGCIDAEEGPGCSYVWICDNNAVDWECRYGECGEKDDGYYTIDQDKCKKCGTCYELEPECGVRIGLYINNELVERKR
jgi:Fe-S-cluster-containing hydrogenase component 2